MTSVSLSLTWAWTQSTSDADKKHDIKRADRLIGNPHLHDEGICFYEMMTEYLVGNHSHPIVIVDWSPVNGQEIFQVFRASIPMGARTLTLYEKVYLESELNSEQAHQKLLDNQPFVRLQIASPSSYRMQFSDRLGLTRLKRKAVGRIRGLVYLSQDGKQWFRSKTWFEKASSRAKKLGRIVKKRWGGKSQCSTRNIKSKRQESLGF